jgi:succinylglutamate desuccinylase
MLRILKSVPRGLLEVDTSRLHEVLDGPTLLHLAGRREPPLFISVLLHGNEPTGFQAVQQLLHQYRPHDGGELPRAVSTFIGNVAAARDNVRRLDEQPDYNRVWPPGAQGDTREHRMMRQVVEEMRARDLFASVDVHNNTGKNPHYACVNRIDHRFLHLATLFSRTVVYFVRPTGVQSMAFADRVPCVTLECGQPGQPYGTQHAREYLDACLHLSEHPTHPVAEHDIDLFHTVATVKVPEAVTFSFHDDGADVRLVDDLDRLNFRELHPGTTMGWLRPGADPRLDVCDEGGRQVWDQYFAIEAGELRTRVALMPSMASLNERVIRQDCLFYLMERYSVGHTRACGGDDSEETENGSLGQPQHAHRA